MKRIIKLIIITVLLTSCPHANQPTIDPIEEMHRIVTESPITVAWDCGGADNSYLV
ncbi:MAG: hypothetical protein GY793_10470, partial [Proteobacteria bacterium]|nr:hypothetical protein [Pseudomonadota bacterium]